jgi:hypothetical protein
MTKIIQLQPNMKLVRIDYRRRGKRTEYDVIGQAAVRRIGKDFGEKAVKSRKLLLNLMEKKFAVIKDDNVEWRIEVQPEEPYIQLDPSRLISVPTQTIGLLADAGRQALNVAFIQAFSQQEEAFVSIEFLEALRLIIQYHPEPLIRSSFTTEINDLLIGI